MQKCYSYFRSLTFILLISAGAAQGMELAVTQQQTRVKSLTSIASKCVADQIKATGDLTDFDSVPEDIQNLIAMELFDVSNPDLLLKSIQTCSLIPNDVVSDALKICLLEKKIPLADQVEALNYACCDKDHKSFSIILHATDPSILMEKFICMTPLYQAARSGCIEIVKEIVAISEDNIFNVITAMHKENNMELNLSVLYWPLFSAKEKDDFAEVIKTILHATGDKAFDLITLTDRMRDSLWFVGLNRDSSKIIKLFLDAVDNRACELICIGNKGSQMQNSLHKAARMASVEILNLLIETVGENIGKIILLQDQNGETVLHKIAQYRIYKEADREKCITVAKLLIAAAGPYAQELLSIKNGNGYTALNLAKNNRNTELTEFFKNNLIEHGV